MEQLEVWVTFASTAGVQHRWQNWHVGQTVNGFSYQSFDCSSITTARNVDSAGLTLTLPTLPSLIKLLENAIEQQWTVNVELRESALGITTSFFGEVVGGAASVEGITIDVGVALDVLTAQVPGRRLTTALVGSVPKF